PEGEQCCLCEQTWYRSGFCHSCWSQISLLKKQDFCRICGRLLYVKGQKCSECDSNTYAFDAARAVGPYEGIFRDLVYQLKYVGKQSLAQPMGRLMADLVLEEKGCRGTDLLIPVPLALSKLKARKFNQSLLLAREIGRLVGLPVAEQLLVRVRETVIQAKLTRTQRQTNLEGAFAVAADSQQQDATLLRGKKIILVDDVLTTGSTASEGAGVLKAAGAREVRVITWATGFSAGLTKNIGAIRGGKWFEPEKL
ncbi:MAG TPA: ComF family protein, partial [Bacillota bacterium]|nr:ComF family protein [Bacillota bacterium]